MQWAITVESGNFITLTFKEFDIYEKPLDECNKDYVDVQDVNLVGDRSRLGRLVGISLFHFSPLTSYEHL